MKKQEKKRDPRIQKLLDENKPIPFSLVYDALADEEKKRVDERAKYYRNLRELREARKSQNLSQQELATKTGIPRATISKIENGKRNVTLETLDKILPILGLSLEFVKIK